jgi:hypothetical protein
MADSRVQGNEPSDCTQVVGCLDYLLASEGLCSIKLSCFTQEYIEVVTDADKLTTRQTGCLGKYAFSTQLEANPLAQLCVICFASNSKTTEVIMISLVKEKRSEIHFYDESLVIFVWRKDFFPRKGIEDLNPLRLCQPLV